MTELALDKLEWKPSVIVDRERYAALDCRPARHLTVWERTDGSYRVAVYIRWELIREFPALDAVTTQALIYAFYKGELGGEQ